MPSTAESRFIGSSIVASGTPSSFCWLLSRQFRRALRGCREKGLAWGRWVANGSVMTGTRAPWVRFADLSFAQAWSVGGNGRER